MLELDPADPRVAAALAHTGWVGRLDVATCYFCNCADTIFWAVGGDGRSEVSAAYTTRPKYLSDAVAAEDVETLKLYLGQPRVPTWRAPGTRPALP